VDKNKGLDGGGKETTCVLDTEVTKNKRGKEGMGKKQKGPGPGGKAPAKEKKPRRKKGARQGGLELHKKKGVGGTIGCPC